MDSSWTGTLAGLLVVGVMHFTPVWQPQLRSFMPTTKILIFFYYRKQDSASR
ncbi:MAG TPA: hypothetical protein VHT28_14030 [Silvibacterium sp.]|jgi:hypothetical protein|nr:hypothetical protein [Silvibacterium sp.]